MTVTATINSGAINEVGFPGSQQGESLIELVGTVAVVATISAITVLSTTGATTAPSANGIAGQPNIKAYLTAAVAPSAEASCGAITKIRTVPDALVTTATVSTPGPYLKRRLSATGTPSATQTALVNVKTFRGATTTGSATQTLAEAKRRVSFGAYLNASAITAVEALRRVSLTGSTQAKALWSINGIMGRAVTATGSASGYGTTTERISKAHFVGATTAPSATSTASTRRNATTSAIISAQAVSAASGRKNSRAALDPQLALATASADSLLEVLRGATIDQPLLVASSGVSVVFKASASTTCQSEVSCAAVVDKYISCSPITASAVPGEPQTQALTKYAGSVSCQAVTSSIEVGVRVLRAASVQGVAATQSGVFRRFNLSAIASGSSPGNVLDVDIRHYVYPDRQPASALGFAGVAIKIPFGAQAQASATASSGHVMRFGVGAAATGQAIAAAVGADYAVTAQAPIERRMSVAYSNRRMEVLT